eukprot:scaffold1967_cov199-Alexandrium_tamarense.AAC.33
MESTTSMSGSRGSMKNNKMETTMGTTMAAFAAGGIFAAGNDLRPIGGTCRVKMEVVEKMEAIY